MAIILNSSSVKYFNYLTLQRTSKCLFSTLHPNAPSEPVNGEYFNFMGRQFEVDSMTNIPTSIERKMAKKLLSQPFSPLTLLWRRIQDHFDTNFPGLFSYLRHDNPIVTVQQNFDELLIPFDHPSRSVNDSYYVNRNWVLRTHMTAHEREIMSMGKKSFILVGDVYRRDQIDHSHMPIFHQMEGVRIFSPEELLLKEPEYLKIYERHVAPSMGKQEFQGCQDQKLTRLAMADLYITLDELLKSLFGTESVMRWQETFFPFTQPSLEVEVQHNGKWMEIFGSGILQNAILHSKVTNGESIGWAFGMGLERVAMILHGIPDIRLFWSDDARFTQQFVDQTVSSPPIQFKPFSKFPPIHRDISFYIPPSGQGDFQPNEFYELIREVASDLVENVELIDEFTKDEKISQCYRITYRSMERTLTDELVNTLQAELRNLCERKLLLQLR